MRASDMSRAKPSRWDRPKPPKDWRYWVGGTGRVLIVVGLLMLAFVAYQLWGTGLQTAQAQNRLEDEFEQLLDSRPATSSSAPTTTAVEATTTAPSIVAVSVEPGAPSTAAATNPPPSTAAPVTTEAPLPPFSEHPSIGSPVARLKIPSIGLNWIVVEGVGAKPLRDGPGHFPETPMPGQFGNAAIAGHRTTFGAPFGDIDAVKPGDEITATTPAGEFVYLVTGSQIVNPNEYGAVIPTTDTTRATLTLVSCHPEYTAKQRIIVFADLVGERSAAVSEPIALPPPEDPSTLPDEEDATGAGTTVAGSAPVSTDVAATTTSVVAGGGTTSVVAGGTTTRQQPARPVSDDAFSAGWFSDPGAWPHVIVWGLALALLVVGCYLLARRYRRLWLGYAVGVIPFVILLYFWFENVNRLLPPNL